MMITKKYLSRRTVLHGLGVTMALPLLDGMVPALAALEKTAAKIARRFAAVYVPNGIVMNKWTPTAEGTRFELTPILEPLAPFRTRLLVLSGLDDRPAIPLPGEVAGGHARASAAFLTGVHVKKTEGADLQAGISLDQIVAKELGRDTQLTSLELALDSNEFLGACEAGYSCAYANTLCWRTPTTPLPMENNPRAVFERLFGGSDSTDVSARLARIEEDRSILDFVTHGAARLRRRLGARDRSKLGEYFDAVRDVERRIRKAEEQSARELPQLERPGGIPSTFEEHAKLMFDLQVLAYQIDLTRVITFMVGRELSARAYPEIGVPDGHHALSHAAGEPEKVGRLIKINTYHAKMLAYFLEKLQSTPDGDGSLLDHSMVLYGSGMSDGNQHNPLNVPILLVTGTDQTQGGRHVRLPAGTPLTNLHLTILEKLGLPMEHFGDSTGKIGQV